MSCARLFSTRCPKHYRLHVQRFLTRRPDASQKRTAQPIDVSDHVSGGRPGLGHRALERTKRPTVTRGIDARQEDRSGDCDY